MKDLQKHLKNNISHNIKHFAIIPDGNRRWAKARDLPPYEGHKHAVKTLQNLLPVFKDYNIPYVTIWAFSTENWKRPEKELQVLFNLLKQLTTKIDKHLQKHNIRLKIIGRRDRLSPDVLQAIEQAEKQTQNNTAYTLIIPIDYGGQDEIRRAFVKLLTKIKTKKLTIDSALNQLLSDAKSRDFIDSLTDTYNIPYPDVILRTSGEMRLSGLYSWQNAYAELFFLKKYFPDLTYSDIENIIKEFATKRDRRFGGNSKTNKK